MQIYQRTFVNEVTFSGIGLHSGRKVNVKISPAPANTGIVFVRTDIKGSPSLKVSPQHLSKLFYSTNLCNDKVCINTVEHLMAALSAFGIDNAFIFIDSEEVPILDGSSSPYIYLFEEAGVKEQRVKRKYAKLKEKVSISYEDKFIKAEPSYGLEIDNTISFNCFYSKLRFQQMLYKHSKDNFKEISMARTFCFLHEVEWFKSQGLAKGGSLDNAIVISKSGVLNESGLRMENEFVAHKTLDLLGDLYILGYPLLAKITAYRTGHALNAALIRKIYSEKAYELIELEENGASSEPTGEKAHGPAGLRPQSNYVLS